MNRIDGWGWEGTGFNLTGFSTLLILLHQFAILLKCYSKLS